MYQVGFVRTASVSLAALACVVAVDAAAQEDTYMQGRVTDENGQGIPNAEVSAYYTSDGGGTNNQSNKATTTDDKGYYRVAVTQPKGKWSGYAYAVYRGWRFELLPETSEEFSSATGATRNFQLRFVELRGNPDRLSDYGLGGVINVIAQTYETLDLSKVVVTAKPVGGGTPITRTARYTGGEGHVISGLRPDKYEISATYNGRALLVSAEVTPRQWASSYTSEFQADHGLPRIRLLVKEAGGGSNNPGPGSDPNPTPAPPPEATLAGFTLASAQPQTLGRWLLRKAGVYYSPEDDGKTPNVIVAIAAKNASPLPQTASGSFQLSLNGASSHEATGLSYDILSAGAPHPPSTGNPKADFARTTMSGSSLPPQVKTGEEVVVYASFRLPAADRAKLKSVKVTTIDRIRGPLFPASQANAVVDLPAPPGATPTPTQPPPPADTPPPDTSGDPIKFNDQGFFSLGRWTVRVSELQYKTPTSMTVSITAKNKTVVSLPPQSVFEFTLNSGAGAATRTIAKQIVYAPSSPVAALKEVVVTPSFDLPRAQQEMVSSITIKELAQPKQGLLLKAQAATSVDIPVQPRRKAPAPASTGKTGTATTKDTPAPAPAPTPAPAPAPTPAPAATSASVTGDFRNTGYFLTRLDAVRRQRSGAVEVTLTMRNDQTIRRSIWNNYNSWTLIGSDGQSYKHDGNGYGRDGTDRMTTSVYLEKDGTAPLTYVYPMPFDVKPVRLVVRDYYGKPLTEFDLSSAPGKP